MRCSMREKSEDESQCDCLDCQVPALIVFWVFIDCCTRLMHPVGWHAWPPDALSSV